MYRLNGGVMAEYKLPGTMLAIKNFPLVADLSVSTALESEIYGDPFTAERDSGAGLISRSQAGISLLGIKLDGNLAISAVQEEINWSAGHELSRAIGAFHTGESFSSSPSENILDHKVFFEYSKIFSGRLDAGVYRNPGRQERKWNLMTGLEIPPKKDSANKQSYIPSIGLDFSAVWASGSSDFSEKNYGELWVYSWRPMLVDFGQGEDTRETKTEIVINEKTRPWGGILTLEGKTAFINNINSTRTSNRVSLEIPFNPQTMLLNFKMERGFKKYLMYSGNDVRDEGRKFGEGIKDSLPLWGVFPFYSLFAPKLNDAMDKSLNSSASRELAEYTWFNDLFGISGQFPSFYDFRAFYIPSSAQANIERTLEQKLDTRLDILYLRGNIGFSAINMFGAFGYKPLFKFYQSDEYTGVLETSIAIPAGEQTSYRVQWIAGAGFRGFTGSQLDLSNTITTGSSGWLESLKIDWDIPTKNSLLSIFYRWIARTVKTQSSWLGLSSLMNKPYEQLLKESMEFTFDYTDDYFNWALIFGHESIIRITGQFNFSVFAKIHCSQNKRTENLSFIGTIGTALNVMF